MRLTLLALAIAFSLVLGFSLPPPVGAAKKAANIGDVVGNLPFKDIRYLPRTLDDFPNKKAFVLAFINTTCPVAQRYMPTLKQLEKTYRDKGVQFLAINVGADDSILAMASQAVHHHVEFPFVKDFDGDCVQAVGVRRTPEVVVLDEKRRLRYRGRIDDQYRLGGTREEASRHDLKEAIEEVLAGRLVTVKETAVEGCLITRPEPRAANTQVTFAEHIAPMMKNHCQECHKPGTSAPFSLVTYQQVAAKANALVEVISDGRMPPWYGSDDFGHFINKRSLSPTEKDLLVTWARSGKPMGDESKLPKEEPASKEASKWLIGKPDLIVSAPKHDLPASGDIDYKYIILPYVFLSDTWMQGIQILPDNPRVLHHCNMAYITPGDGYKQANFMTGTVPGGAPMILDHEVAFHIPKTASLVLQIHYVTTGKPEKCQISVGFKYAAGTVRQELKHLLIDDNKFAIPPGAPAYEVASSRVLQHDAIGLGLFVHMHLRGRDMTFRAHYPDGTTEDLLLVPNYNFDWQIPYRWAPGKKRFPKGTRLEAIAHYDNSTFNPFNPNPKDTVKEGPQTRHEMMNGFVFYTDANENLDLTVDSSTGQPKTKK